ncbi:DUF317 domain-containing protein [Streptomyces sp. NBC_01304]|uniref:DUF317 domain-containing protein n=1 Tax=Streptomyces sp. NBC_01304 TaxID=2903818 RepID=UPI002E0F31CE|nr:DUF317 domain-containing protein [Streptomyces sp. NBC_01304]
MSDTVELTLVSPVYLAGRGDPGWVTVPLHRASGWSYGHDPLMPRVLLTSPNQQAMLRIDPDPDEPWWTISHARTDDQPAWQATFDAHTPVEIIAAFTDALTNPRALRAATPPTAPLRQAGWRDDARQSGLVSPDGVVRVEYVSEHGLDHWFITVTDGRTPDDELWEACLDGTTPPHLVAALTRALTDATPVIRDPKRMPGLGVRHRHDVRQPVPVETVAFALENRVKHLTGRHPQPSTPPAQLPSASSPGRTP